VARRWRVARGSRLGGDAWLKARRLRVAGDETSSAEVGNEIVRMDCFVWTDVMQDFFLDGSLPVVLLY
jgi:hypothetical protein